MPNTKHNIKLREYATLRTSDYNLRNVLSVRLLVRFQGRDLLSRHSLLHHTATLNKILNEEDKMNYI